MIAFTEQLAYQNAQYGIRANVILPGLMNTPMAVDTRARHANKPRAEIAAMRDGRWKLHPLVDWRDRCDVRFSVECGIAFLAAERDDRPKALCSSVERKGRHERALPRLRR